MNRFFASLPNEIAYDGPEIDIDLLIKVIRATPGKFLFKKNERLLIVVFFVASATA